MNVAYLSMRPWPERADVDLGGLFLSLACELICWQSLRKMWRTA
jgi:hypothetical protein